MKNSESVRKPAPERTRNMNISPTDTKRRALGKGLDSLLPRVQPPAPALAAQELDAGRPREITLELIDRNPFQTRSQVQESDLAELAASIVSNGVVQPILVRPQPNGRFQLIAGERRWRASQLAKKATIPAILRQVSDEQAMEITIVENLQREDLNPMDQARAFERLATEFHMTQEQIATRTGKDRVSVANFMRLLKLPPNLQHQVESGQLSFGHARALLALRDHPDLEKLARRVVALSLSVRQTESMVQNILNPEKETKEPKPEPVVDPNVREVKDRLQRALGLKVSIEDKNGRGKVIIQYSKLEEFDTLLEQLAGK
jgi:ParB family transcriptional regulator, chromosome partitioning protein